MHRRIWAVLVALAVFGALEAPVAAAVPDAPTGVVASLTGVGEITVSWSAPADGGSPILDYSISVNDGPPAEASSPAVFSGLVPGPYTFAVTARNAEGSGSAGVSNSVNVPVPAAVPDAPTGVVASLTGVGEITVSWSAPADGGSPILDYSISVNDGPPAEASSPAVFSGLVPGPYTFAVTARNAVGSGSAGVSNSVNVPVPANVPDAPSPSASLTGVGEITVSWSAPAANGSPILDYTVTLGGSSQTVAGTSAVFSGLAPGDYSASVSARNAVGSGSAGVSNSVNVPVPANVPDAPSPSASLTGVGEITVSWSAPAANGSPILDYTVTLGGSSQTVAGTSAVFSGLAPGDYSASVSARNAVGSGSAGVSNSVNVPVPANVPDAPSPSASLTGVGEITVSWSAPAANGSPILDYTVTLGGSSQTVAGTSAVFSGLAPGDYSASVSARNAVGSGSAGVSNSVNVPVPANVPDAPSPSASLTGVGEITVSWSAPAANGSPILDYTVTLGGSSQTVAGTSAVFSGLAPGDYSASVSARNAVGSGSAGVSNSVNVPVPANVPDAPSPSASLTGVGEITVSWSAPAANGSPILDYTVTLGGSSQTVAGTSAVFSGLAPGDYSASVSARNAVGSGASGASNSVNVPEPLTVPSAPTGVSASLSGDTGIAVNWSPPADDGGSPITGYTVVLSPGGLSQTVTTTTATFTGLTRGVTYTASVVANNAVGQSPAAGSNAVTIAAPSAPDAPTSVVATALANGQLFISWVEPNDNGSPITVYAVFLSDGRQFNTAAPSTGLAVDAGPGTWTAVVVAVNAIGFSQPSGSSNPVTIASAPGAPTGVFASVAGTVVTISWIAPPNNGAPIQFYTVDLSNGQSQQVSGTSASFTLPPGTYTATVAATNSVGEGPASAPSAAVTVVTTPSPPTAVDATATGSRVDVVWQPPASNGGSPVTSFTVFLNGPTPADPVTVNAATRTASFANLGPGSYSVSVVANNALGGSAAASVNVSVGALTPSAPRDVRAVAEAQEIVVTWTAPSDGGNTPITGYQITLGLLPVQVVNDPNATSAAFFNVPEGGPYVVEVRAINGAGPGDAGISNEVISTLAFAPFFSSNAFVIQQYRDFLGRSPDGPGRAFWVDVLDDNPANGPAVIESFMGSPEFAPRRQVARLYLAYFDRPPDREGFDFWSRLFISGDADLGVISAAFADSQEFKNTYGDLANIEFVALVYNNVLLRAPDGPGLTYWTSLLNDGMNRGEMMIYFSESAEFIIKSTPAVDVIVTYRGMLDRAPDAGGYRFWVRAVAQSRDSLRDLIESFLISQEYSNRITR